jgi:hypothetical protein
MLKTNPHFAAIQSNRHALIKIADRMDLSVNLKGKRISGLPMVSTMF